MSTRVKKDRRAQRANGALVSEGIRTEESALPFQTLASVPADFDGVIYFDAPRRPARRSK
jgi:hypothetical protein